MTLALTGPPPAVCDDALGRSRLGAEVQTPVHPKIQMVMFGLCREPGGELVADVFWGLLETYRVPKATI